MHGRVYKAKRFMTVIADVNDIGINLCAWHSPVENAFKTDCNFPHKYETETEQATIIIECNIELTNKAIAALAETSDKIISEGIKSNQKRKIANR